MSYAEVAKDNIPAGEIPQPNQDLRDGVAPTGEKTWEQEKADIKKSAKDGLDKAEKKGREFEKKARAEFDRAETALEAYWNKAKEVILRPSTLGGLVGVVNVGLIGSLGYWAYLNKDRPWDRRQVGAAVAGTLALFGVEGYVAESYLETPEGRAEAERAKKEGSKAYLHAKEVILRPNVAGGLAGVFNLAVLGAVGYFAHKHWNEVWDRKVVGAVTAGLLVLTGIEGALGKEYVDKELPKH
ncbi:hypothetical protein Q8F55_004023 [Vanrija albida]|uniref:Mitochondrial outer membrane protein OM14 C-terminal domain-containing protein n=1 Tax=Vanrija albida TaxID=181172 RepID=A0ABR3Q5L5_9TREE